MYRHGVFVLFLAMGLVFHQSNGIEVNVTDKDGKLCLYANLMVNISVAYEVAVNKTTTVGFELAGNATSTGSVCNSTSSLLKLNFGQGHSWSMNFSSNGKTYQANSITFSYNLKDTTVFPGSVSNETVSVVVNPNIEDVGVDTCYSCRSKDTIQHELVNQTLWNVLIQVFVTDGSKSENMTTCAADNPTTTVAPTTHTTVTTPSPVTNATTTTPPVTTTTTPAPTLPSPTTGNYTIRTADNSTVCLLAHFGLRIGLNLPNKSEEEINVEPRVTNASGSCGDNSSDLVLVTNSMTIVLTFTNDTKKFRLLALNITGISSSGLAFSEVNTNLSLWETSLSSSYMCNKEQNYTITNQLTIYTFQLQVQPFGVKKGVFSTAEECFLDSDLSFLVPIAVGVALSFLIILVLISYLIGRRKSRTGYQSV